MDQIEEQNTNTTGLFIKVLNDSFTSSPSNWNSVVEKDNNRNENVIRKYQ